MRSSLVAASALALSAAVAAPAAAQTKITIVNVNAAGVGFNDPTPATPVGGNTGTTKGAQKLIAFQAAADYWAGKIASNVEIRVQAQFTALECTSTSAILGSAGPMEVWKDTDGLPVPNTWYVGALANKLAGKDLDPGYPAINARFSSSIDADGSCGFPRKWYYGLDGSGSSSTIDLMSVVIHELGHGLGFLSLVNGDTGENTGAKFGGFDDIFSNFLFDATTGATWNTLTDAQRRVSAESGGSLLWNGPNVTAATGSYVGGIGSGGRVMMYAPAPYAYGSSVSHWDRSLTPNEILEPYYTSALHDTPLTERLLYDLGWSAGSGEAYSWLLPSSAKAPGQGGAYYTTALKIGNRGGKDATFTLKFLGHDADGSGGPEQKFNLAANKSVAYDDVLGSVFGLTQDYGAIRITASVDSLAILSETSTPFPDKPAGTFGQSVPAFRSSDLIGSGVIRSIVGIREDASFRTNLILANASTIDVDVQLILQDKDGNFLGQSTVTLPPLGMTQVSKVANAVGAQSPVTNAQLLLSTPTSSGQFAAYAAAIDNTTNDPRTLLPR